MLILGIHDGHDCSAALLEDGRLIAAAQEERFSGLKGDYGYPKKAIEYCLNFRRISGIDLDRISLSSTNLNPVLCYLKRNANFSVNDWVREQTEFWYPRIYLNENLNYFQLFETSVTRKDSYYNYTDLLNNYMATTEMKSFLDVRVSHIQKELKVPADKIVVTNHELNHKCYALFASPFRSEPVLILTSEGIGDQFNGTVSIYRDGKIETVRNLTENRIGHIYQYVTLILGMKPGQHEYKVMGLAPYSNHHETEKAYKVFKKILKVEGMEVKWSQKPPDLYFYLRDELKHCRFDGIAGGAQKFVEELLVEWVRNCVLETGISTVVFAGGVAQNVKANKAIFEMIEVKKFFVPPAAGDTSNSIGSCFQTFYQMNPKDYRTHEQLQRLETIYLGPDFSREDCIRQAELRLAGFPCEITLEAKPHKIAQLLKDGKIIGVMRGRMEFGLRALGNRSILANPADPLTIDRINSKIKFRDFWMPFTPTMLDYRADDYISNPKGVVADFMSFAFDSVPENRSAFPAAMHPADKSVRAQVLKKEANPDYYDLIEEFEKLTGHGVLLNTSFNLHGDPVVLGPEQALDTFKRSGMDALVLEDILIEKK